MGFEPYLTYYEVSLWVFGPFIALLCSAEVEAYFSFFIHNNFFLSYTPIIVYGILHTILMPIVGIKETE